jgi:2-(1,2-epoxy-1,2-dihydrophenyl)acetyl-CoA isomerase
MTALSYEEFVAAERERGERLVVVERVADDRALVRLDDPATLNALSAPLTLQLHDALSGLAADPAVRTIVLTGTDPGFSAGGDLRLMEGYAHPVTDEGEQGSTAVWRWIRQQFGGIARLITRTDKAFVAAVNGPAAGVGLAFALASDLIVVSERARLVPAFGRIGLVPEVGTSWLLTRRIGYQRTFELFAGGRHVSGHEAHELGIANDVVEHDELLPAARAWCDRLAELPDHVVPMTKTILRQAADMTWDQAIAMEEFAEPATFTTDAHRAAVRELLSKDGRS